MGIMRVIGILRTNSVKLETRYNVARDGLHKGHRHPQDQLCQAGDQVIEKAGHRHSQDQLCQAGDQVSDRWVIGILRTNSVKLETR
jgi:hypothetical protein